LAAEQTSANVVVRHEYVRRGRAAWSNGTRYQPSKMMRNTQSEWMDLKALQAYACVSERTIRDWIHLPVNPLRASQADAGKLLVKRSHFDAWLEAHPYQPINSIDVDQITDDVIGKTRKGSLSGSHCKEER
jgi:hypothetical protein